MQPVPGIHELIRNRLAFPRMAFSYDAKRLSALLLLDVDINLQGDDGMTALHWAAARGARPCIRLLVASGKCDYLIRDLQGRYAADLAFEWARDYAVGRLLLKKQAQQAAATGQPAYVPRS